MDLALSRVESSRERAILRRNPIRTVAKEQMLRQPDQKYGEAEHIFRQPDHISSQPD